MSPPLLLRFTVKSVLLSPQKTKNAKFAHFFEKIKENYSVQIKSEAQSKSIPHLFSYDACSASSYDARFRLQL